jgi:hypothetical protein
LNEKNQGDEKKRGHTHREKVFAKGGKISVTSSAETNLTETAKSKSQDKRKKHYKKEKDKPECTPYEEKPKSLGVKFLHSSKV